MGSRKGEEINNESSGDTPHSSKKQIIRKNSLEEEELALTPEGRSREGNSFWEVKEFR